MASLQVTCIIKSGGDRNEHITHIGNKSTWGIKTKQEAIKDIDGKINTFYVTDAKGKTAYVGVVREIGKDPYLRTYADNVWTDNLLALPNCS